MVSAGAPDRIRRISDGAGAYGLSPASPFSPSPRWRPWRQAWSRQTQIVGRPTLWGFGKPKPRCSAPSRTQRPANALTADNPAQQRGLDQLYPVIDAKMAELTRTVTLRRADDADAALAIVRTNEGRDLMRRIRTLSDAFDATEVRLLDDRQEQARLFGGLLDSAVAIAVAARRPAGHSR